MAGRPITTIGHTASSFSLLMGPESMNLRLDLNHFRCSTIFVYGSRLNMNPGLVLVPTL
jgi:hypothetical protein